MATVKNNKEFVITTVVEDLYHAVDQQSLLSVLREKTGKYNIFDLVRVQGFIADEIKYLPSPYKEICRKKWNEQLFSTIRKIRCVDLSCNEPLNLETYYDFLKRFEYVMRNLTNKPEVDSCILYNLCAAYNLFITKTPVHPVGTPFPGGFKVQKIGDEYFCPVKDKNKYVFEAVCRFCIAKQSNLVKSV
ncbi:MAG: hypothetical protein LAKADJCE_00329 [Candidatus Argoarchaeum ethanivorans]|uniref:UPF0305 protein LAKADJCE_00329 n=1 Tax=Candidatus Argoarchaeum ethanivorans TaxID=2608793 RepID=A0A811TAB3_9EURY|nr:MAG: hypothetical protein LAKADJCE_00329 [Candidatus Argoarchaeum ethanivorans]